jgi:atrial natriuretic peptide receptor A
VTGGALVNAFSEKSKYRLLTRLSSPYAKVGKFAVELFQRVHNWTTFGVLYQNHLGPRARLGRTDYYFAVEGVYMELQVEAQRRAFEAATNAPTTAAGDGPAGSGGNGARATVDNIYRKAFDLDDSLGVNYTTLLLDLSQKARIVVLCASADAVREIMIEAAERHFDSGEYVFFNIDLFASKSALERPWYRANDSQARNDAARRGYEAVLTVTLSRPDSEDYLQFTENVRSKAREEYKYDVYGPDEEVNSFVGAFHDAVLLYALAVNETLEAGIDPSNGSEVTRRMWNRTFQGITGTVSIDENGDRNGDYALLDMNTETGIFQPVANYFGARRRYEPIEGQQIHWGGGRLTPPPDVPRCGFDGKGCLVEDLVPDYAIVIIVFGTLLLIVTVAALVVYRHYRLEVELQAEENWRVRWDDILVGGVATSDGAPQRKQHLIERNGSRYSRRISVHSNMSADTIVNCQFGDVTGKQLFTETATYKATLVAVKHIEQTFAVNKQLLLELKKMRDLQNDHVVRFVGLCIDIPHQCLLTEYCQKGSLQDVLENERIKLDNVFKFSLIQDLVRAMSYLHGTDIRSHGNLKSSNCVVDGRFVLKVTDFGLHSLRARCDRPNEVDNVYAFYRAKLWTAPELLRMPCRPPEGTQKGDVYSFAVICQEIVHRRGPFWVRSMDHLSPQEIYMYVKDGHKSSPVFRPTLLDRKQDDNGCSEDLAALVRRCWTEDPLERPDFNGIKSALKRISKTEGGASGSLLDNLLSRMEQYAYNLEALVDERTADYLEQKKRAEDLLYMMLPRSVAVQLMRGETVQAEKYEGVTIYFSDICGFTSLSAVSTPMQVVSLLNDLYTTFDSIIDQFDVYKVETIGDAYMVVSGLPIPNGFLHAREIGRMALRLLKEVKSFRIQHRPDDKLLLRIGIHSGPVCAGIVGLKMPRYCLFGDTVNTASRMESNGEAWKIHVSPQTKEILDVFGSFKLQHRGLVAMKGKGEIDTWWLLGENNLDFPDLTPQSDSEL